MNDEQRGMAPFGAQPEVPGLFWRDTALPLACVPPVRRARGGLSYSCAKIASGATIQ